MKNNQYKGFAYTKMDKKPTIVYGTSKEDILAKLNSYNIARTELDKFTVCNIGSLNNEVSKYEDYHRYEVATGKDISSVYLQIPPLKNDEFQKVVADLKAAGARFSPHKKAWYITADKNLQEFQDICNQFSKENTEDRMNPKKNVIPYSEIAALRLPEEPEKPEFQIEGLEIQYAVKLQNQQTVIIPESALNMWKVKGSMSEFLNKLNEKAVEQLQQISNELDQIEPEQIVNDNEYMISVDRESHFNRCTVWFNDGREPLSLNGYLYDLDFLSMENDAVAEFVAEYLKRHQDPERLVMKRYETVEYNVGDSISCYVPLKLQNSFPNQPIYVENIIPVIGHVQSVQTVEGAPEGTKAYEVVQARDGSTITIRSDEIYAPDQAKVLERAAADELTGVEFDLLADKRLTSAQMEEIRFGYKDGLSVEQVALYANPEMTPAEMDICRIGLTNGLEYVELSRLLKETKELSWTDSRNRLNEVIKEHREKAMDESIREESENQTADFFGTEVPVENGMRVISSDEIFFGLSDRDNIEVLDFTNCIFHDVDFSLAFWDKNLSEADFSNSRFYDCKFDDVDLSRSSFQGASLYHTPFKNAILNQCDFSKATISGVIFQASDVVEVNFSEAAMKQTVFRNCAMEGNNFLATRMDAVDVDDDCDITADQKYFDTITYTMGGATNEEIDRAEDRVMWRLSGSEITYERKEELIRLMENTRNNPGAQHRLERYNNKATQPEGKRSSVVNQLQEKQKLVSSAETPAREERFRKADAIAK